MQIDVLTLFPGMIEAVLGESIIGRARDAGLVSTSVKSSFPTPQSGQVKSSGNSSNFVPATMPSFGSPTSSSYSQPQTSQIYLLIATSLFY